MNKTELIKKIKSALNKGEEQIEKGTLLECELLESISGIVSSAEKESSKVYAVVEKWSVDGQEESQFTLFATKEDAEEKMSNVIHLMKKSWCIYDNPDDWEVEEDSPECYETINHYKDSWFKVEIEEKIIQ